MRDAEKLTGARLALDPEAVRGAVGERIQGPWTGLTHDGAEARIAQAADALAQAPDLEVRHVDWDCYGQGLASAVPVVVSRTDDDAEAFRVSSRFGDFEAVVVALCRLAPLACVARPQGELTGHDGMLGQGEFVDDERSDWREALHTIDAVLTAHGIERLSPAVLNERIDPSLVIDTNFGDPPFTVFDAWFHWWD